RPLPEPPVGPARARPRPRRRPPQPRKRPARVEHVRHDARPRRLHLPVGAPLGAQRTRSLHLALHHLPHPPERAPRAGPPLERPHAPPRPAPPAGGRLPSRRQRQVGPAPRRPMAPPRLPPPARSPGFHVTGRTT